MAKTQARRFLDKRTVEASVMELAEARVHELFDRFDHICVGFSGGKDSTVCLNLCLNEARTRGRPLSALFYDEEAIPYQTEAYVRRVAELPDVDMLWLCLPVKHVNACSPGSPWWFPWAPEDEDKWVRPMPPEGKVASDFNHEHLWASPETRPQTLDATSLFFPHALYGQTAYVMGIRADESMTRLRAVTRRKGDNWIVPDSSKFNQGNVYKCYPIYDWKTEDVWTAPARFKWDVNDSYDLQELHGFHGSQQRIAPPFGAEPMQMLSMYKTCFPELWEKMCERVPGASTAARYSRTELYSFRGRPRPSEGETWKELIVRLLERHAPETREEIRTRIASEIKWHYSKVSKQTRDPILPLTPHPITGMSIEWLAMIAMRGDLKKRKVAGWQLGDQTQENRERIASEYREAYEQWKRGELESI